MITVCRNSLPALRRTVASVLAQEYPALEYLIVDGASTDGTPAYLDTLPTSRVRTFSAPDRGISDAMNKGVRLATGEWVVHLHAGDAMLPGALSTVARHAAATDADVLCGWMIKRERSGETVYRCDPARLPFEMTLNHPATATRRVLFDRHGGFDVELRNCMDYDFFLRLQEAGVRFQVIPEPLAHMEWGGQSERSAWRTIAEGRKVRLRHASAAGHGSLAFALFLLARLKLRETLQRVGLGGAVAWFRRRFALLRKG